MAQTTVKTGGAPSESVLGWALFGVTVGTFALLTGLPRPVVPRALPSLHLDARAVSSVLAADARLAEAVPDDPDVAVLEAVVLEMGHAERAGTVPTGEAEERAERTRSAVRRLRARHGDEGLFAVRARAARVFDAVLARRAPSGVDREGVLGRFPAELEAFGLTERGRLRAPAFVVRTAYKARWNAIARLELTDGFEAVERQAHAGWLALGAPNVPPTEQLAALEAVPGVAGPRELEARATLLLRAGDAQSAEAAFLAAFAVNPTVRLRNHALAAALSTPTDLGE